MALGLTTAGAAAGGLLARVGGRAGKAVEQARAALRIPPAPARLQAFPAKAALPAAPANVSTAKGFTNPWRTPNAAFYRIDTALVVPAVDPGPWRLKIGGMVDRPVEFDLAQLMQRPVDHAWVSLTCVSNPVGGELAGNALWTGTRIAADPRGVRHPGRCRRGAADLRRRLDLCHAARGPHRRPQRPARVRDERRPAAAPARVPAADGGSRPVRLRVGHQVAGRARGDQLRQGHGVLDRTRLEREGPDQAAEPHRHPRRWCPGGRRPRDRHRLDAAHRHLEGAGAGRQGRVARRRARWPADQGQLAALELALAGRDRGRSHAAVPAVDALGRTQTEELADVVPDGATGWHTGGCFTVQWRRSTTAPRDRPRQSRRSTT